MINKTFGFKLDVPLCIFNYRTMSFRYFRYWLEKHCQTRKECPDSVVFCDLDDTLLQKGQATGKFMPYWKIYEKQNNAALVYNTGRPMEFVAKKMREGELHFVEFVIANQGKNVYCNEKMWQPWVTRMRNFNFTIKLVDFIEDQIRNIDIEPCKLSVDRHGFSLRWWISGGESLSHCSEAYMRVCKYVVITKAASLWMYTEAEIEEEFSENDYWKQWGIECELQCAQDDGSKAPAAQFLMNWFNQQSNGISTMQAIWAGDGMDDEGMLTTGWQGIVVGNADEHLKVAARKANACGGQTYVSASPTGNGVVEGLRWWSGHWRAV